MTATVQFIKNVFHASRALSRDSRVTLACTALTKIAEKYQNTLQLYCAFFSGYRRIVCQYRNYRIFQSWKWMFCKVSRSSNGNAQVYLCKDPFTLAICAAISSAIFFFWCMWTSRWVMNVLSMCTLTWTFISYPLVHIHQKKKIAPKIAAKIASVNRSYKR